MHCAFLRKATCACGDRTPTSCVRELCMQVRIPTLAKKLKELRRLKGWSQTVLAAKAVVAPRVVQFMESGDGASVIAINKVAKALGVLPENLIDRARCRAPLSDSYELDHEHVFVIGPVIRKPRQFFGREQALRRLFALLKANPMQSSLIIGPSRSGKTSLLRHLEVITTTPANQLRSGLPSAILVAAPP